MEEKKGVLFMNINGSIFGVENRTKLNALPWYKKLITKISKRYRSKFISIEPIELE